MKDRGDDTPGGFFRSYKPVGIYSPKGYVHAMRAGNTLYIAGQVARDQDGVLVAPGDAEGQAHQVYRNLLAVLGEAGATPQHVVKLTTYLVDPNDAHAVGRIRQLTFGEHRPPHTGLVVAALGGPDVRVEVEAVAVLPPEAATAL